jgi:hypothetical protein
MCASPSAQLLFVGVILFCGCSTGVSYHERLNTIYQTGMHGEAVQRALSRADFLGGAQRPAGGWCDTEQDDLGLAQAACLYERERGDATVHSCEVYRVGRVGRLSPLFGRPVWDYLFFDGEGRLLEQRRRYWRD